MNRVQELIDENKDQMPTALAKVLLDACKEEADATKQLYTLTWTTVEAHAHVEYVQDEDDIARVKLVPKTQTLIVEAVGHLQDHPEHGSPCKIHSIEFPHHGMVLASWMKLPMPNVIVDPLYPSKLVVIHSILPYEPKKRLRDR